ncbi:MAG: pyridoxal-phosphate dependent enzyme [Chitinophagales bacterium]
MVTPLQQLSDPLFEEKHVVVFMKRDDLIHPQISGNKWRKLKYNLQEAREKNYQTLLTFGGAYSNHIYAVAAAGKEFGFKTIGIIRGEKVLPLNQTLSFASDHGMMLQFISREDYRQKENDDFIEKLRHEFGNFYLLPEGGTNTLAVKGCKEIVDEISIPYDYICTAVGTGGTLAGLIAGSNHQLHVVGFSVLKGMMDIEEKTERLLFEFCGARFSNWTINHDYHFGGYAKANEELFTFIDQFKDQHHITLDPVYTGKMMFGIYDLIRKDYFSKHATIIALNTGREIIL